MNSDKTLLLLTFTVLLLTAFINTQRIKKLEENQMAIIMNKEIRSLVGKKFLFPESLNMIEKYGHPVMLKGTTNENWIGYFHIKNFTIVTDKKTDAIIKVLHGQIADEAIEGSLTAALKRHKEKSK